MKKELTTLRLWNPLFPHIYPRNEWGDLENNPVDLSAGEILEYEDKILDLIERERLSDEGERGLAVYLDDDLSRKVYSITATASDLRKSALRHRRRHRPCSSDGAVFLLPECERRKSCPM